MPARRLGHRHGNSSRTMPPTTCMQLVAGDTLPFRSMAYVGTPWRVAGVGAGDFILAIDGFRTACMNGTVENGPTD